MICKICNEEMLNRQKLAYHLNHTHGINIKEYNLRYKPDKDDNLLECPICGRYNMKQLTQHITDIHKLTKDEFLTQYPNTKLWIDEISERCSKAQSKGIQTFRNNLANDPHHYDDMYDRRSAKCNYKEIADKIRQTRIERGTNEKMSERIKLLWQNEDYRNMQIEKTKRQHREQGLTDCVMKGLSHGLIDVVIGDKKYRMRSSWEVQLAESLHKRHIEFLYEPFYIKYSFQGKEHKYYPDFYIESHNLIIEVKPERLCEDEKVIAKKNACLALGFNFIFVTQNELKDIENLRI